MSARNIDPDDFDDLRARLMALESIVTSLQAAPICPSDQNAMRSGENESLTRPSRRHWLGMLAAAGLGSALDSSAVAQETSAPPESGWKTYSPKLMGEKTDPVLGEGVDPKNAWMKSGQNGHYWQSGKAVIVKTWHQFAIGAQPGLGHYRLSLPVKAALGSDAWLGPTGIALMHCHATKVNRTAVVILAHAEFVVFQIDNMAKNVGHDHPWVWAKGDGLNTFMIYEASSDS
jgi:hypothetical protein